MSAILFMQCLLVTHWREININTVATELPNYRGFDYQERLFSSKKPKSPELLVYTLQVYINVRYFRLHNLTLHTCEFASRQLDKILKYFSYILKTHEHKIFALGFYRAMHYSAKRGLSIAICKSSVCLSVCLWRWCTVITYVGIFRK